MKTPTPWTVYDTSDPLKIGIKGFDRKIGGMHVATVIMPENAELIVTAVNNHDALVKALTLAEDILSRAPFSNALWPNGMHPMIGITQIRDALALVGSPRGQS
jgi:hypothetical protein